MADIVDILRLPICGYYGEDDTYSEGPQPDEMRLRAADEIERLRAVCQQFAESADFYEGENGVVRTLRMNEQKFVDACRAWGRLVPSEKVVRRG